MAAGLLPWDRCCMTTMPSSAPVRRAASAERFAHKAMTIVNAVLLANAERNERSLALARLVMCLAYSVRLVVLYSDDLADGQVKDWFDLIIMVGASTLCVAHLTCPGDRAPWNRVPFRWRQSTFVVVDLVLFGMAIFPAILQPELGYDGILRTPYVGVGTLVAVGGGMRLRPRLALLSSGGVMALFLLACVLDVTRNPAIVAWGVPEFAFDVLELSGAALLGVLVATRTLSLATESAARSIDAERARERFGAYVGHEVAAEALRVDEIVLGGVRQPVAVLFSDLRGFTSYAEQLSPEILVTQLNAYLEEMVAVITSHGGVVDKYIGDGIMAVFGAPRVRPDDAVRALRCAEALTTALTAHNRRRTTMSLPPLRMGVGVHYGTVVAGNIGTVEHAQYTVIGDVVNLASRLENATKDLQVTVLVSQAARDAAGPGAPALVALGSLAVRGRAESVDIYALASEHERLSLAARAADSPADDG